MFHRLGRIDEAWDCYRRALPVAQNERVRHFIERRNSSSFTSFWWMTTRFWMTKHKKKEVRWLMKFTIAVP